jgi:CBS domain containing-hemolysin-like protein
VIDKYGGTEGVVTMEDFIETLLGLEIVDEVDRVEDMQEIARKQWERRAQRVGLLTGNLEMDQDDTSEKSSTDPI